MIRLREVEEILAQKQSYLQHKIQTEMQIIVKNGTKNKRIAVQALKRKKRLESFLAQIDDTIMSLEYQREGLESQQTNIHIFKCLEFANNTLKHIHEGMGGLENAEHMMDDIREQQQCLNHIHYLLSNPGFGAVFDENELMQELDDIQNEENHKLPNIELLPSVPVPPVAAPRMFAFIF